MEWNEVKVIKLTEALIQEGINAIFIELIELRGGSEFSPFYRVLSPTELNEPLVIRDSKGRIIVENKNELNDAELGLIKYFNSKTVGDIVFNYWD
ncbi:hypothetical protein MHZ92_11105 [Sporosarcina sp. ACRSL]|uniref:hypothetical protein n=1 Tax=Sporosarcina sp. ACRSL TaxID=2918215 RepID=UPI001EF48720|nr:hypothetical protein [Sporosarcina sp. ACRSL]MCG7344687.1 hypothetical protein [Sporosarcina sp. ACRSL]